MICNSQNAIGGEEGLDFPLKEYALFSLPISELKEIFNRAEDIRSSMNGIGYLDSRPLFHPGV